MKKVIDYKKTLKNIFKIEKKVKKVFDIDVFYIGNNEFLLPDYISDDKKEQVVNYINQLKKQLF